MAITKISTASIEDDAITSAKIPANAVGTSEIAADAVTTDELADAINTERTANTAKDLTALSASNLTSGTVPDARFPATLPAASAANLTAVPAANITGTLPAISATNLTNIPAANITGTLPAISGANLTGISSAGRAHNLIINGAMLVAQRGTSFTATGSYPVDRFRPQWGGTDANPTVAQVDVASGTTPYTSGFRKALKITNADQSNGAGTGDYMFIRYKVEAQDLAQSGWNYTSASSNVTLSFWVKSSVAQTFQCRLESQDGTKQNFPFEIGSLSADTWTKITKTIPGNSNITINNDTGTGMEIWWELFRGTDETNNSVTNDAWQAETSNRTKDQTSTWYTTNTATFEITGVQLEVGDSATDFEHLSYAENLTKCERYFQSVRQNIWGMTQDTNGRVLWVYPLKTEMRTGPTVSATSTQIRYGNQVNAAKAITNMTINRSGYGDAKTTDFAPSGTLGGGATTAFDWQFLEPGSASDATFHFSAEL